MTYKSGANSQLCRGFRKVAIPNVGWERIQCRYYGKYFTVGHKQGRLSMYKVNGAPELWKASIIGHTTSAYEVAIEADPGIVLPIKDRIL